jgi:cell wall-associated NlpC family hydrolase
MGGGTMKHVRQWLCGALGASAVVFAGVYGGPGIAFSASRLAGHDTVGTIDLDSRFYITSATSVQTIAESERAAATSIGPRAVTPRWTVNKAATYADRYARRRDPAYRSWGDDCTNFVSQAMRAGGRPFTDLGGGGSAAWWYAKSTQSSSWINANNLNDYFADHHATREGRWGPGQDTRSRTPSTMWRGDVIFYDWSGGLGVNHAAMQALGNAKDPTSGWRGTVVDEHTSDRYHAFWSLYPYNSQASTTTYYFWHN